MNTPSLIPFDLESWQNELQDEGYPTRDTGLNFKSAVKYYFGASEKPMYDDDSMEEMRQTIQEMPDYTLERQLEAIDWLNVKLLRTLNTKYIYRNRKECTYSEVFAKVDIKSASPEVENICDLIGYAECEKVFSGILVSDHPNEKVITNGFNYDDDISLFECLNDISMCHENYNPKTTVFEPDKFKFRESKTYSDSYTLRVLIFKFIVFFNLILIGKHKKEVFETDVQSEFSKQAQKFINDFMVMFQGEAFAYNQPAAWTYDGYSKETAIRRLKQYI